MQQKISPARSISGSITLPGDKSISHRYAMIASIAEGDSRIRNYSTGADCHSTLDAMRALGVPVEENGTEVTIRGRGLDGLRAPAADLDAGNSGSTIRMLSGILAAQSFPTRIGGDESLSRRPMARIIEPLSRMGANISAREGRFPPLEICGGRLRSIDYTLPVPSAQVKTCVLFAGLYAEGETIVREPVRSRDHTEIALREFGADLRVAAKTIALTGRPTLTGRDLLVPADLSSAAFFVVAALLAPGSRLTIRGVGLNPTRSTLLDFLAGMGAAIRITEVESRNGELAGELLVSSSRVRGGVIEKETTAELRIKETDRISTVAENLHRMGVEAEELPDGLAIPGRQRFHAAELDSFGDHRIAMAFAIAALCADGESLIHGAEAASVSFPEFFETLRSLY
jgi:3-phosphoshikimate 1-carboxyvinyltransferase